MRNKNRVGGRLTRMRELYARLCAGWGGRTERFASAGVRLPNPPMQLATMPSPEQGGTKAAQRAQAAISPIRSCGVSGGLRVRGLAGMQPNAANSPATYWLRGLAGVQSSTANSDATYGLRGLAGMQSSAASGGATFGLRRLAGMQSSTANSDATYGVRGLAGVQSNAANGGATYGLRRLAGMQSSTANGGATYGLPASLPGLPLARGMTGRAAPSFRGAQANAFCAVNPAAESTARGKWMQRVLIQSAGVQTAARATSSHETLGLRGLAGVRPAQQSLPRTPPAPPLRIPSPPSGTLRGADAAAAQVQVVVTNNCKIETPVDYQTVWDKLEDALRESLSIVAAGG